MAAKTQVFKVGGMSCNHCVNAVKSAVSALGVDDVDVELKSGNVTVSYDPGKVTEEAIKKAIEEEGYTVE
ncbi:MAG: heavy-metal-associated domain-containing protein [Clostridiales bacterium]|nr:heavy-metal-associated domain-containing protein [Clostridiales bacterium]